MAEVAEEVANEEYEEDHKRIDEHWEGKIFVLYPMLNGIIRGTIYFSDLPAFKREIEKGKSYLAKNMIDFGRIKIQKTKKGKRIKLEKIDLSNVDEREGVITEESIEKLRR